MDHRIDYCGLYDTDYQRKLTLNDQKQTTRRHFGAKHHFQYRLHNKLKFYKKHKKTVMLFAMFKCRDFA